MIIVECEQGSPEWHKERAGVITASMFETARAKLKSGPNKGQPTSAALDYAFRLAVERISGSPLDEGFQTWQMKRGNELEPAARMEHEIQSGLLVKRVGLVLTDDRVFGASADGFIEEDGGSEYKCFLAPEKLRSFHIDNDASGIMDQVQGCMWITGRKWWHIGMYCPALEPVGKQLWWQEFKRDDNHIEEMESELWQFKLLVDSYETQLRTAR
ncbi:MAG: YqaJ viral recombinase family protein [bacterium]|nr:YqaJ viral recombinase family protein [bacterium]